MTSFALRAVRGAAAATLLLLLLVATPVVLLSVGADLVERANTRATLLVRLINPDDGTLLIGVVVVVGWFAWLGFVIAAGAHVRAQLSGRDVPRLRGLEWQQHVMGLLIAAVLGVGGASSASAAAPPPAASAAAAATAAPVAAHPRAAPPPAREDSRATHVVRAGESLWSISEDRLGRGRLWPRLLRANRGLIDEPDLLRPGWVLTLPAPVSPARDGLPVRAPDGEHRDDHASHHVVRAGETLSGIARRTLGDSSAWQDILAVNGELVRDPDLLLPGWVLQIPARVDATSTPEPPPRTPHRRRTATGDEAAEQRDPRVTATSTRAAEPSAMPSHGSGEAVTGAEPGDTVRLAAALGGAGLLSAGLIGLLTAARRSRTRTRRPGERLPTPSAGGTLLATETELRRLAEADLAGAAERALQALVGGDGPRSTPPPIRALRLTAQRTEAYLTAPAGLPSPWHDLSDRLVWTALHEDLPPLREPGESASPYPCIVTLGTDPDGGYVLLNLEEVGSLGVGGSPADVTATLTALTLDLLTATWADDVQVTVVGELASLGPAACTGRLRRTEDAESLVRELEARASDLHDHSLARDAATAGKASGRDEAHDLWAPEIVVLTADLPDALHDRLQNLVSDGPAQALVVLTGGRRRLSDWNLELIASHRARLEPTGIDLEPPRVPEHELAAIMSLLDQAVGSPLVQDPRWLTGPGPRPHDPAQAIAHLPTPSTEATPLPGGTLPARPPQILLLGPPRVIGTTQEGPHEAETELLAYLSRCRDGVDLTTLRLDLHLSTAPPTDITAADPALARIEQARRWLGDRPDGTPWLPAVEPEGRVRLPAEVGSDWETLGDLLGPNLGETPDETLQQILDLIGAAPLDGLTPDAWPWSAAWREEMTAGVLDVLHEAAERAIQRGDAAAARAAATRARRIDPDSELVWRDALRAEYVADDAALQTALTEQLLARAETLQVELEPPTELLLDQLSRAAQR